MFVITHALSPVVLAGAADAAVLETAGRRWLRKRQYLAIALSGAMPDLLWPHLSLEARYASPTHTVWFLGLFALFAVWAGRFVDPNHPRRAAALMAGACAFHLVCDAIAGGIKWGYPFFSDVVGWRLVPYWTWPYLDLAMVALTGALAAWLRWRERTYRPARVAAGASAPHPPETASDRT
jgi:hypothetical protein